MNLAVVATCFAVVFVAELPFHWITRTVAAIMTVLAVISLVTAITG